MKKSILLTGISLMAAGPLLAQPAEQQVEMREMRMDAAPMTRSAVEAQVKAQFAQMDANKDGAVTRAEMEAQREARMKEMRDHMFAMIDTNNDGSISRAEFDAHHAQMGRDMPMPPRPPMPPKEAAEHDDHASHESHQGAGAAPQMMMRHEMRAGPGAPGMDGDRMFDMADGNKDGRVTQAEATAAALSHFDQLDTNKDGSLSAEERMAGWRMMHKRMKGAPPR